MFPIVTHYIPLCLYLYWMRWRQLLKNIHLHSTMLLLIPVYRDTPCGILCQIYIPLCFYLYVETILDSLSRNEFTFHYASTYTNDDDSLNKGEVIYIPLCFYLYGWVQGEESRTGTFTFHYASTYTCPGLGMGIRDWKFTFHYASTYTIAEEYLMIADLNLHSTMLLLIRSGGSR